MDQVTWWRIWVTCGLLTCIVAFACCLNLMRHTRSELAEAFMQVKNAYEVTNGRLDLLSGRMDQLEEQLLRIILHLFPDEGAT